VELASIHYGPYFGASFTTLEDVVNAISPLADFSIFSETNWMKQLADEGMRDLLKGIMAVDSILESDASSLLKKKTGFSVLLPGIVFMRWITGNYDTRDYKGTKRLALAARIAKRGVKLSGKPPSKETPISDMVLAFLDVGSDDSAMLKEAFAWINKPGVHLRGQSGLDIDYAASYLNNYANKNGRQ
jgi:hypothetical protein